MAPLCGADVYGGKCRSEIVPRKGFASSFFLRFLFCHSVKQTSSHIFFAIICHLSNFFPSQSCRTATETKRPEPCIQTRHHFETTVSLCVRYFCWNLSFFSLLPQSTNCLFVLFVRLVLLAFWYLVKKNGKGVHTCRILHSDYVRN